MCCVNPLPGSHRQHGRLHTPATGHTDVGKSHACGATVHSQHFILMTGAFICACRLPWISYGREDCIRKWVEPFRENRDLFVLQTRTFPLFSNYFPVLFGCLSSSHCQKVKCRKTITIACLSVSTPSNSGNTRETEW